MNRRNFLATSTADVLTTASVGTCGLTSVCAAEPEKGDVVAIVAAMDCEVKALIDEMTDVKIVKTGGYDFYCGKLDANTLVVVRCGMGKVSAAMCAQAAISTFKPDYVVNTGCAGGIAKGVKVGDVVISTETVEWDLDTIELGAPRGYVTEMDCVRVKADAELADRLITYVEEGTNVRKGLVASGDAFVSKPSQRELILDAFPDALCAEMEGAAIGHVCAQNGVPFCVVRAISDTADADSHVDFAQFAALAGEKSAATLVRMLTATENK